MDRKAKNEAKRARRNQRKLEGGEKDSTEPRDPDATESDADSDGSDAPS